MQSDSFAFSCPVFPKTSIEEAVFSSLCIFAKFFIDWPYMCGFISGFCMYVLVTQSCLTLQPHRLGPIRLLCPWNSPGKNTGMGSHSLLHGSFWPRNWTQVSCRWTPASQVALVEKDLPANAGDVKDSGLIPGSGISPGGGHGNPLQYSYLENTIDRGAWRAIVHRVAKSQTQLKQLSTHTFLGSILIHQFMCLLCARMILFWWW